MKIKIKFKHLVFIITGFAATILLFFLVAQPQWALYTTKKALANDEVDAKGEMLALLDSKRIFSQQKWGLMEDYLINQRSLYDNAYDVVISPSFVHISHHHAVRFFPDEAEKYLEKYVKEALATAYTIDAAVQLALIYAQKDKIDAAYELMETVSERFKAPDKRHMWEEVYLAQLGLAEKFGDDEKFAALLADRPASAEGNYYFDTQVAFLEAKKLWKMENIDAASKLVNEALGEYRAAREKEQAEFPDEEFTLENDILYNDLQTLKSQVEGSQTGAGTVTGEILYADGKAAANVGVFLRAEDVANQSLHYNEPFAVMTDEAGQFTFSGVMNGHYQINLGMDFTQIDGWTWPVEMTEWLHVRAGETVKYPITLAPLLDTYSPAMEKVITEDEVTFSWEGHPDADYYTLYLGMETNFGSQSIVFRSYIDAPEITVAVEDLYKQTVGVRFAGDSLETEEEYDTTLLGFADPERRYFWSVSAHDANGDIITRSDGYRLTEETMGQVPIFHLKNRTLTKADELVLENKLEEALAQYEADFAADASDLHSLRMITRLIGARAQKNNPVAEAKLVMPYLDELVQSGGASPGDVLRLAEYFIEFENWEAFHETFALYEKLVDGHLDDYDLELYNEALKGSDPSY